MTTAARLSGRVSGGSTDPGFLPARSAGFRLVRAGTGWPDALPGGGDPVGPELGRGDLEDSAASAADQTGGGMQEAVVQHLRLCSREVTVKAMNFSQASRMQAIIAASSQAGWTL
jgi:hypothetical protein